MATATPLFLIDFALIWTDHTLFIFTFPSYYLTLLEPNLIHHLSEKLLLPTSLFMNQGWIDLVRINSPFAQVRSKKPLGFTRGWFGYKLLPLAILTQYPTSIYSKLTS
jgi:hypothetical protein